MTRRPSKDILDIEDLLKVFNIPNISMGHLDSEDHLTIFQTQKIFQRLSRHRIPFRCLLGIEQLLVVFEALLEAFYTRMVSRCQKTSQTHRRPSELLDIEDLPKVFQTQKTPQKSSSHRRTSRSFLRRRSSRSLLDTEDLPEVFSTQKTFQMSSSTEELLQFFQTRKTLHRSFSQGRPSRRL